MEEKHIIRTERRVVGIEGLAELKKNLQNVAGEIDSVRRDAYAEAKNLEKIRGMLNVDYLDNILVVIESFEERMLKIEQEAIDAIGAADRYRMSLEAEQGRLSKLWEAYKKQEDELRNKETLLAKLEEVIYGRELKEKELMEELKSLRGLEEYRLHAANLESEVKELESQLYDANGHVKELETEIEHLRKLTTYKEKYEVLSEEIATLEHEVESGRETERELQKELRELREYIPYKEMAQELEAKVAELEPLAGFAHYKELYEESSANYNETQERMAKLYKVYEDNDAELRETKKDLDGWKMWFDENYEFFRKICEATSARKRMQERVGEKHFAKRIILHE
ncbi:MAG: hypothetical protein CVT48_03515 [Thermoplasmata archaeon HGW-Thermoplasmata-1]|nr:MAG: hypothetical protein CVT48_03515 [Thermoplasmata archaeon HGW-Thermoplasmata-1]